jgi:hypothetical protein
LHKVFHSISNLDDAKIDRYWKNDNLERKMARMNEMKSELEQLVKTHDRLADWKLRS